MKQKIKRIFEKLIWWSGVITIGIIFGLGIQLVLAWTEPSVAPPGGNVAAPINESSNPQWKWGSLGLTGVLETFGFKMSTDAGAGKILTSDASGIGTWQAGGGGVPSGFVGFFNLSSCPSGWSELTAAQGRYLVGLPSGGTLAGTQGTALSNLENRPAGAHTHNLSPYYTPYGSTQPSGGAAWDMDKTTSIKATDDGGLVAGTNAPYIQLLACQKN